LNNDTWTHRLARLVILPMLGTRIRPNHLTTLRLLTGLAGCLYLAVGPHQIRSGAFIFWGGMFWLISAFLDRMDGELARVGNMMSPGGHRYDYLVDNGLNCLFFLCVGIGLTHTSYVGYPLHDWPLALGIVASVAMFLCNTMAERYEAQVPGERIIAGAWGFHADDALYLLAPAAWFGLLPPILFGAAVGTSIIAVSFLVRLLRLPRQPSTRQTA